MNEFHSPFAHPNAFWLLPALGLALLAVLWGWRQRRRAIALLGKSGAVQKLLLVVPGSRRWGTTCLLVGMALLLLGSAGPRWGREFSRDTVKGHDIVVILDVSRSMLAEQPSRMERALRALRDLADHLERRGGQRLALVIFAARPYLVFPLTRDYDHFRQALANIEAGNLTHEVCPPADDPPPSGTRLGAGLRLAVQTLDAQNVGPSALLLLSDGDDPEHDEEWRQGVQAASAVQVPVHTVGIGDPTQENTILIHDQLLEFDGKIVQTKLEENVLQDIARRTGGIYVPAHTNNLPLGSLLPDILRKQAVTRPPGNTVSAVPILRQRQGFFLWPALVLLSVSIVWGEKRQGDKETRRQDRNCKLQIANQSISQFEIINLQFSICNYALVFLSPCLLICLLAAAFTDNDWIRQGNAAFARNELTEALALYEKAEVGTNDPGLVAFNKAAVYSRLDRQREAELHYRRCLEDDRLPASRKAQALFGLGNTLLRQARETDVAGLDEAVDAFSNCLTMPELSAELKTNVEYNLELARWLRFKAVAAAAKSSPPESEPPPHGDPPEIPPPKPKMNQSEANPKEIPDDPGQHTDEQKSGDSNAKPNTTSKRSDPGPLTNIPEDSNLKLIPEDAAAYLEQVVQRIAQQQRSAIQHSQPASPRITKDW